MNDERETYLALIDLSPHFIDRVSEVDYGRIAAVLGVTEDEARDYQRQMTNDYLTSIGLTRGEVVARMARARGLDVGPQNT